MDEPYQPPTWFEVTFQFVPLLGWGLLLTTALAVGLAVYTFRLFHGAHNTGVLVPLAFLPGLCGLLVTMCGLYQGFMILVHPPAIADRVDFGLRLAAAPFPAIVGLVASSALLISAIILHRRENRNA